MILHLFNETSGCINLASLVKDSENNLSTDFLNILNINFDNNGVDELFFLSLLKVFANILDGHKGTNNIEIKTIDNYNALIKFNFDSLAIVYYSNNKQMLSISINYNIYDISKTILEDYKRLAEQGILKRFLNQDSDFMRILNKYYIRLENTYKGMD